MNKKEALWRLRRRGALIAILLASVIILTLTIYYIMNSRPDPDALTVGLENEIMITLSEKQVADTLKNGTGEDNVRIIEPSLYSVVQPNPQTDKYGLFEQMIISQSCDLMIGTASTARELYRLGLILPVEGIGFEFDGEYLSGCAELGYVDFTGYGDYFFPQENDTVCAYVLINANNRDAALNALNYINQRFDAQTE